jgi:hypothetical protein
MSLRQKALAVGGAIIVVALALFALLRNRADPPILIGDGSVTFQSTNISINSPTELEITKFLHKVRSITVMDATGGAGSRTIDVKQWSLTSTSGSVTITPDPQLFGLQEGVKADCPTPWNSTGTYTCIPSDNGQFTPATLKYDGGQTMLTCPSGKCQIQLEYKK